MDIPVSRRYCIESLITLGIPSFSPSYPIKSSSGTAKMFARICVGRMISLSNLEFSLEKIDVSDAQPKNTARNAYL